MSFPGGADTLDVIAWTLWATGVIAYNWYAYNTVCHRGTRIQLSLMMMNNPAWVAKNIRTRGSEVTSVQTLRNTIIVATFVGGFAFTNGILYIETLKNVNSSLTNAEVRILVLSSLLFIAFLNFALVVRSASHLGYLMGTATGRLDAPATAEQEAASRRTALSAPPPTDSGTLPTQRQLSSSIAKAFSRRLRAASAASEVTAVAAADAALTVPVAGAPAVPAPPLVPARPEPETVNGGTIQVLVSADTIPAVTAAAPQPNLPIPAAARRGRSSAVIEANRRVEAPLTALEAADIAIISDKLVKTITFHFSLGFRVFYIAIPVALYAAGPIPFIVSAVLTILWLIYIDHGTALM